MGRYFSFQKLITTWFVQVMYFVGFLLITAGGIALTVWAGLRLNDATISRELGWRYVAAGIAALIAGNLLWRVFCEIWVIIFRLHDELVVIRHSFGDVAFQTEATPVEVDQYDHVHVAPEPEVTHAHSFEPATDQPRSASVLGLS